MIGCNIDNLLLQKFPKIVGYRFVDDYHLYFSSQAEAEQVFKYLQSTLSDYTLNLNEEKTTIRKFPFEFESEWVRVLNDYTFPTSSAQKARAISNFVSLTFKYCNLYPKDSVIKYSIKKLSSLTIKKENWNLYESLILKMCISEPSILPTLTELLIIYKDRVDKTKLKKFIHSMILEHCPKGHSFEVSWTLWICKTLSIKLSKPFAEKIFLSSDYISILIALDMKSANLIHKTVKIDHLLMDIEAESFKDERWLFAYEAIYKKWLIPIDHTLIHKSKYFHTLRKLNISFYDTAKQVNTNSDLK